MKSKIEVVSRIIENKEVDDFSVIQMPRTLRCYSSSPCRYPGQLDPKQACLEKLFEKNSRNARLIWI
jgi:hypothetical protein